MTGYTYTLVDNDLDFQAWVLTCARAMGVCIRMRDEPMSKLPPDRFEPSSHHKKALETETVELARLKALDQSGIVAEAGKYLNKRKNTRDTSRAKDGKNLKKLRATLERTRAWEPPTADHRGLKEFMVSQLEQSIRSESHDYHDKEEGEDATKTPESVVAALIEAAERSVTYHETEHQKEVERTAGRNRWLADLRASLA